jgi:hypothetical protein
MVVRTGAKKEGRVAIVDALTEKDRVIRRPPQGLRDGAPIAVGVAGAAAKTNEGAAGARVPR